MWKCVGFVLTALVSTMCAGADVTEESPVVLLDDDLSGLRTGAIMNAVGAHTEYHYLPHASHKCVLLPIHGMDRYLHVGKDVHCRLAVAHPAPLRRRRTGWGSTKQADKVSPPL